MLLNYNSLGLCKSKIQLLINNPYNEYISIYNSISYGDIYSVSVCKYSYNYNFGNLSNIDIMRRIASSSNDINLSYFQTSQCLTKSYTEIVIQDILE
jgi:hypothetical protein